MNPKLDQLLPRGCEKADRLLIICIGWRGCEKLLGLKLILFWKRGLFDDEIAENEVRLTNYMS